MKSPRSAEPPIVSICVQESGTSSFFPAFALTQVLKPGGFLLLSDPPQQFLLLNKLDYKLDHYFRCCKNRKVSDTDTLPSAWAGPSAVSSSSSSARAYADFESNVDI